jgi:hypothetical protein
LGIILFKLKLFYMDVTLSSAEQVVLRIAPADAEGNAREVSNAAWSNSGSGVLTVAEDGMSATYVPADSTEDASDVVTVTADADLTDAGVVELSDSFAVTVTGVVPQAATLGLSADAPTPKVA